MEQLMVQLAALLALGISASWLAWRLRFPSILLLLVVGFLTGPVTGLLNPDALLGDLLFPVVSLSVAVILFEGGLSLNVAELREIGSAIRNLATIGVLVTWVLAALSAYLLLDLDWALSILLGAILIVTGPTVIVPLLRHVRPTDRVGSAMKWEAIVNDPLGAILAVLVFEAIIAGGMEQAPIAALGILRALLAGGGIGLAGAAVLVLALRRYWIPDFLQNPAALTVALLAFTLANAVQTESGLLAVTVMGSALASQTLVSIRDIVEFKENLRVLLISVLFVVLAARLSIEALVPSAGTLLFVAGLILVVRPLSVVLATWGTRLSWRERCFLGVMAPRGIVAAAVASVFALELTRHGHSGAETLVTVTFFVIVGTVFIYGLSAAPVARWLRVASPNPQGLLLVGADSWVRSLAELLNSEGIKLALVDSNWSHVSAARQLGVTAYYGSILSEHTMEELELDGLGRLLALTPNDEVNALAALHFSDVFGRANVYQLPVADNRSTSTRQKMPQHLRGRFLFDRGATYDKIAARCESGATIKRTPLTGEFDFDAFMAQHGETALPLFALKESGELVVLSADGRARPTSGQTLISLVGP
jgi:NhaP-type Na+/H+ or K+/H+ antiporter